MLFKRNATTNQTMPSQKRSWVKIGVGLLVLALIGGALFAWRASSAKKEDPKKDADKVFEFAKGDLAVLTPRDLGRVVPVSGSLKPVTQALVKSKVAAEVARVHVQEGERVAAGRR